MAGGERKADVRKTSRSRLQLPLALLTAVCMMVTAPQALAQTSGNPVFRFHARTPLGAETLRIKDTGKPLHMFLTMESPQLQNATLTRRGEKNLLLDADGHEMKEWPSEITLRFTTSNREKDMSEEPLLIETSQDLDTFQSTLRFRLKIFDGLESRDLMPDSTEVLGVPLDMPSDERIYLLHFRLGKVPISNRMMFEVLDSDLQRVTKFGVQLN